MADRRTHPSQSSIRPGDDSDCKVLLGSMSPKESRNPVFALEMIQTFIANVNTCEEKKLRRNPVFALEMIQTHLFRQSQKVGRFYSRNPVFALEMIQTQIQETAR